MFRLQFYLIILFFKYLLKYIFQLNKSHTIALKIRIVHTDNKYYLILILSFVMFDNNIKLEFINFIYCTRTFSVKIPIK